MSSCTLLELPSEKWTVIPQIHFGTLTFLGWTCCRWTCCAKLYGQEKKNKTQKKLSKEYLLSNDASKQISTRSSWNNTITLLCLDFDTQRAQSIRQGTWDLLLSKLMDVSLHAGGFILWCLDRIPRSWFGWSVRSVKYLSSEINGFAFCLCLLDPKLKSMSLLFGYD